MHASLTRRHPLDVGTDGCYLTLGERCEFRGSGWHAATVQFGRIATEYKVRGLESSP